MSKGCFNCGSKKVSFPNYCKLCHKAYLDGRRYNILAIAEGLEALSKTLRDQIKFIDEFFAGKKLKWAEKIKEAIKNLEFLPTFLTSKQMEAIRILIDLSEYLLSEEGMLEKLYSNLDRESIKPIIYKGQEKELTKWTRKKSIVRGK